MQFTLDNRIRLSNCQFEIVLEIRIEFYKVILYKNLKYWNILRCRVLSSTLLNFMWDVSLYTETTRVWGQALLCPLSLFNFNVILQNALWNGKAQYSWVPCSRSATLNNVITFFYKISYPTEKVNWTEPFPSVSITWMRWRTTKLSRVTSLFWFCVWTSNDISPNDSLSTI